MFCIGLAMVFAGASAASVVDRVQHSAAVDHTHGAHLGLTTADDHHDHGSGGDPAHDNGDRGDVQTGPGHHHSDAPTGVLTAAPSSSPAVKVAEIAPPAVRVAGAKGVRPGGLDRPPRLNANLV